MERAEELYHAAQAERGKVIFEESERIRTECLSVHVPKIIELSAEFLQKMKAADFPIAASIYVTDEDAVGWHIGDNLYVFSTGGVAFRTRGMPLFDLNSSYERVTQPHGKYDQSHIDNLIQYIVNLNTLIGEIDSLRPEGHETI
jgi:hypothetical protein